MKLYDGGRAPNPRRVRIFLAEKGITVPLVQVDLAQFEHRTPDFTAKNPMQGIPVLELDDGTMISESVAICRYFEELHPTPPLFGTGALERAMVEMWNRRLDLGLYNSVAAIFRHSHPAMAEREVPQVPDWAESNRTKLAGFLRILDDQLASHTFVTGETYTIADITAQIAIDFMKLPKLSIPDDCTNILRWHALVSARASAKA
ncbi:MAG: glutathione S-transferase family protein [Beijerinckiaceae bacterium]